MPISKNTLQMVNPQRRNGPKIAIETIQTQSLETKVS